MLSLSRKKGVAILMKIALGSDHGGFNLKNAVKKHLEGKGIDYRDFGCFTCESIDYPDVAYPVAQAVASGEYEAGIIICGTGIGVSIVANKVPGIRAALCHDCFSAKASKEHNDANVLTMGERVIGQGLALEIVDTWLNASFSGGRHARRVGKIMQIEREENKTDGNTENS
jgi:ribose 5-phosphate isomerase B